MTATLALKPLPEFVLAIDPGKNTGVCMLRRDNLKVVYLGTQTFYQVQLFIARSFRDRSKVRIFIEHPPKILYERNVSYLRDDELQIMLHAGGNRREAELLAECLTGRGFEVYLVPPIREEKWDQKRFTLATGSHRRTSEHERDATRLGMSYANWRKGFR